MDAVQHGEVPAGRRTVMVLLALVAVCALAFACWRYVPAVVAWLMDARAVRAFVAEHAVASRLVMVGINVLQIVLAFLPGEPVELASGYAFGFLEGTVLCLAASALGTALVFAAVRRWGARVVHFFFKQDLFEQYAWLQDTRRLSLVMLVVFLIPGTPKDFLTYFAGLTNMRFSSVLLIATFGRIPSIVTSTVAAAAAGERDWVLLAASLAVAGVLALAGSFIARKYSRSQGRS